MRHPAALDSIRPSFCGWQTLFTTPRRPLPSPSSSSESSSPSPTRTAVFTLVKACSVFPPVKLARLLLATLATSSVALAPPACLPFDRLPLPDAQFRGGIKLFAPLSDVQFRIERDQLLTAPTALLPCPTHNSGLRGTNCSLLPLHPYLTLHSREGPLVLTFIP